MAEWLDAVVLKMGNFYINQVCSYEQNVSLVKVF